MERINLYLWISEAGYPQALARSLQETEPCYAIRIIDSDRKPEELPPGSLLLTDRPVDASPGLVRLAGRESGEDGAELLMYQSARGISEGLKAVYGALTGRRLLRQGPASMKIIGFFGAEGGAGCTSLAQAFGQEMRRFRGRRVLVLSLEEFPSTDRFFPAGGPTGGLARMLGSGPADNGSRPLTTTPFETADDNGVLSFQPPSGRNPLREMEPEDFLAFLESLADSGRYDVLVADCGAGLDPVLLRLAVLADRTVLVAGEGGHARARVRRFCETLEHRLAPGQQVAWHRIENRMGEAYWALDIPEEERDILRIPEEPESFQESSGLWHLNLDKELGRAVRALADRMGEL
jgi:hypothetical protein